MIQVLVVDDDPIVFKAMLKAVPWQEYDMQVVGTALNGQKAIDFLKSNSDIDIVFTDIKMPHMDGVELIRQIHEISPHILFVVLSSYSDFELVRNCFHYGATDYLLKFDIDNKTVIDALLKKLKNLVFAEKKTREDSCLYTLLSKVEAPEKYLTECSFKMLQMQFADTTKTMMVSELISLLNSNRQDFVFGFFEMNIVILIWSPNEDVIDTVVERIKGWIALTDSVMDSVVVGASKTLPYEAIDNLFIQSKKALNGKHDFPQRSYFVFEEELYEFGLFSSVCEYIEQNYDNNALSLADLQKALLVNKKAVSRCLLQFANMHFKQYLNGVRINHAKELLKSTNLRINEVSDRVGYRNSEHFSRVFSAEVGSSPSTYAEKSR